LGPNFPHWLLEAQSHGVAASLGKRSLHAARVPGLNLLNMLQEAEFFGTVARGTEPAGLHLLLTMEQWEQCDLLTEGHWFPWHFRVK
jgi:hypothetical protein